MATTKKSTPRHDLRHPVSGKFVPKPENLVKKLVQAHQAQQQQRQKIGIANQLGGGAGILPLLMALKAGGGQGAPMGQQAPQQPPMPAQQPPQMPSGPVGQ